MSLSAETLSNLQGSVNKACVDAKHDLPGVAVVVVGKDGNELFAHSAGKRGLVSDEPMTLDTIFWIASCTKMLTGFACMQLVEQGVLKLDDGDHLEDILYELKSVKVLREDGSFEDKKNKITLRMLLTHTSGFGYTFSHERLRNWSFPVGIDEFSGRSEDVLCTPLLFQPGEAWEYGVSTQSLFFFSPSFSSDLWPSSRYVVRLRGIRVAHIASNRPASIGLDWLSNERAASILMHTCRSTSYSLWASKICPCSLPRICETGLPICTVEAQMVL
jgi:hypothetical protein